MAITQKLVSKAVSFGAKKWGSSAQRAALKKAIIASAKKRASNYVKNKRGREVYRTGAKLTKLNVKKSALQNQLASDKININRLTANTLNSKVSVGDLNNTKREILNKLSKQPKTKIGKVIQWNRKRNLNKVEKQISQNTGAYSTNAKLLQRLNAQAATNQTKLDSYNMAIDKTTAYYAKISKQPYNPVTKKPLDAEDLLWKGLLGYSVVHAGVVATANYNIRKENERRTKEYLAMMEDSKKKK